MKVSGNTGSWRLRWSVIASLFGGLLFGALTAHDGYGQAKSNYAVSSGDSANLRWDVVSVKMHSAEDRGSRINLLPDGVRLSNLPLQALIVQSYGLVLNDQIEGLPGWANSERFDIEAKVASGDVAAFRKLSVDQVRAMGRPILMDRFKLVAREEKRVLPLYSLVVAKGGSKLKPSTLSSQDDAGGIARTGLIQMRHASSANGTTSGMNELTALGVTMDRLASALSQQGVGRVVVDDTGLTGRYDFSLTWASDATVVDSNSGDTSGPSIFTAFSEQLGLKLEPRRGPVAVLVIEHIEMPSEN